MSRYVGGPSLDLGLGRQHDAMAQGGQDDVLHVVGQDVVAPFQGRDGPRPAQDRHAGAGEAPSENVGHCRVFRTRLAM